MLKHCLLPLVRSLEFWIAMLVRHVRLSFRATAGAWNSATTQQWKWNLMRVVCHHVHHCSIIRLFVYEDFLWPTKGQSHCLVKRCEVWFVGNHT